MDRNQIEELVKQLKAAGLDEEKIMDVFYEAFTEKKMGREDLETLANFMGYELTDDFKEETEKTEISDSGVTKEELEDAKTVDKDESVEEFKKDTEELAEEMDDKTEEKEESDSDGEWKEAQKLFRL